MSRIVVLFNLKEGVSAVDYEAWAKETDIPNVRSLKSIGDFQVFKSMSILGSDATPPYAYIEILDVANMEQFGPDTQTAAMQKVAAEFQALADNPTFIMTSNLEDGAQA